VEQVLPVQLQDQAKLTVPAETEEHLMSTMPMALVVAITLEKVVVLVVPLLVIQEVVEQAALV
jgi:hypothetical protein